MSHQSQPLPPHFDWGPHLASYTAQLTRVRTHAKLLQSIEQLPPCNLYRRLLKQPCSEQHEIQRRQREHTQALEELEVLRHTICASYHVWLLLNDHTYNIAIKLSHIIPLFLTLYTEFLSTHNLLVERLMKFKQRSNYSDAAFIEQTLLDIDNYINQYATLCNQYERIVSKLRSPYFYSLLPKPLPELPPLVDAILMDDYAYIITVLNSLATIPQHLQDFTRLLDQLPQRITDAQSQFRYNELDNRLQALGRTST